MKKLIIALLTLTSLTACNSGGGEQYNNQNNHSNTISTTTINSQSLPQPIPNVPAGFETDNGLCQARSQMNGTGKFYLLVGTVSSNPIYQDGAIQESVELSHTHFHVLALGESNPENYYDVAADNVFAAGYDQDQPNKLVPSPLNSLIPGTEVELCGITYADKNPQSGVISNGIHWVHIANQQMTEGGWTKIINPDGTMGNNLENNTEYLYLWSSANQQ